MPDALTPWLCLFCGKPIAPAERKQAVKALRDSVHIGRAHPACKERYLREQERKRRVKR